MLQFPPLRIFLSKEAVSLNSPNVLPNWAPVRNLPRVLKWYYESYEGVTSGIASQSMALAWANVHR